MSGSFTVIYEVETMSAFILQKEQMDLGVKETARESQVRGAE